MTALFISTANRVHVGGMRLQPQALCLQRDLGRKTDRPPTERATPHGTPRAGDEPTSDEALMDVRVESTSHELLLVDRLQRERDLKEFASNDSHVVVR